jgi:hypothetical protein
MDDAGFSIESPIESGSLLPIGPVNITPRQWAYGRFLLFGNAAVLGAIDGGGKGAIAVVMALAVITGKPLLGERVWRSGPVAIITYEDDETEWHRRIAAACLHYDLDYAAVLDQVHFIRKPGGRVSFAAFDEDGRIHFPHSAEIVDRLRDIGAVLLIVDPFNHAHALEDGNNNLMVAKVAAEMAAIGYRSGCAVLVLHHLRKGASGNPDDLMGATSLRATFRSCRILARMTPEQAEKMKVADPWRYIRIAGSKENYAPPPEKSVWFKLIGVSLGNATEEYPDGDDVAVAITWQPRQMFDGMDAAQLRAVFEAIRQTAHSPSKQAKQTTWAGKPLVEIGGRSDSEAGNILKAWLKNGVLEEGEHYQGRNKVKRVTLNEGKAAEILTSLETVNAPSD